MNSTLTIGGLGRVVIHKEIRRTLRIREGDHTDSIDTVAKTCHLFIEHGQKIASCIVHFDEENETKSPRPCISGRSIPLFVNANNSFYNKTGSSVFTL